MTSVLDKLNLRPQERRLVVGVSIVVFVIINFWLVWPYFGELGRIQQRSKDSAKLLQKYNDEIKKRSIYEKQLKDLEGQGNYVASDEQASQLQKEVIQQAALSAVFYQNIVPMARSSGGKTNSFFEEQGVQLTLQNTGEKELVDFLQSIGAANTLIRVKTINIRPDPTRMKLSGQLTLVKSYQRKPPPKAPTSKLVTETKPVAAAPPPAPKKPEPTNVVPPAPTRAAPTPIKPAGAPTNSVRRPPRS